MATAAKRLWRFVTNVKAAARDLGPFTLTLTPPNSKLSKQEVGVLGTSKENERHHNAESPPAAR